MAHTSQDKLKLVSRLKRLQGQIGAAQTSVEAGEDCYKILMTLSSARGALNGLMGDIVEGHIREHVVGAKNTPDAAEAGEETIEILRSFWK